MTLMDSLLIWKSFMIPVEDTLAGVANLSRMSQIWHIG